MSKWLNGVLIHAEEGSITAEFEVREDMCNPAGILHGGTSAALLDDIIGMTVYTLSNNIFYSSVNLSIDYLFAAKCGEKVIVTSKIIRMGKKIAHAEGNIKNTDGQIIAKCSTNLVATSNTILPG
ncbi:PaaI family thioesterase [Pseudarcicella hirudinis]